MTTRNSLVGTDRAGLLVTARARSSRIPHKMLADVGGRPALAVVLERMKAEGGGDADRAAHVDVRIVCTSSAADDDRIADLARAHGWAVIRGDEEDVLSRYLQAALEHELEFIINVDGDDLFCSVEHVGEMAARFRRDRPDFISVDGLPFGGAPVGVKSEALRDVCARKTERITQGWGKYFTKSGEFTCATLTAPPALAHPELRITLDYEEDLALARAVVGGLGFDKLSLPEVVAWLLAHPDVAAGAQAVTEKYWERFHTQHDAWGLKPRD